MQPRARQTSTVARPVAPAAKTGERALEQPVDFALQAPQAQAVFLAGSFNDWDPRRTAMRKEAQGWRATLWLPPGRYEYRFVVDGEWVSDPKAADSVSNEFGSTNSVLQVA